MTLDDLEKISRIAFSGLGTVVLGYFTVTGKWNEFTLQEEVFCVDNESYYMQAALRAEGHPSETLIERIRVRCGFNSTTEAEETFYAEKAGYQQLLADNGFAADVQAMVVTQGTGVETAAITQDGWVALASLTGGTTTQNFTPSGSTDGFGALSAGDTVVANWPANLRLNTESTTGKTNPSLAILDTGACVTLAGDPVEQRGIIWAPVQQTRCEGDN